MNERIRELAEQAGYTKGHHDEYGRLTVMPEFNKEKFAELIVKECIQVGGPEDSYTDDWFMAKTHSVAKIKEHFGVKE